MSEESPKLMPARMHLAEHERNVHVITVEVGVEREHLKDTAFWSLVSNKLRPYDRIEVRRDDGLFYAEYLVLACDRSLAKVYEMSYHNLTTSDVAQTEAALKKDDFDVKYRGPHSKHSVIRKSDGAVIKEEFQTRDEAEAWMKQHKQTVSA